MSLYTADHYLPIVPVCVPVAHSKIFSGGRLKSPENGRILDLSFFEVGVSRDLSDPNATLTTKQGLSGFNL